MNNGLYARFTTSRGEILVGLEFEKAPMTVGNFVALVEGTMKNTAKGEGKPYYDGLKFHRVIEDFMIQGGDPTGTGAGGPGYNFEDEIHPELVHKGAGILSMANAGPNTNGSQFFITHVDTPWLDGKHTVFGKVINGQDVVDAIQQGDTMERVEIVRIGGAAEAFDALKAFESGRTGIKEKQAAAKKAEEDKMKSLAEGMDRTSSGLFYKITQQGTGKRPNKGQMVEVHYEGFLTTGQLFDSSYQRSQPLAVNIGVGRLIRGWDEGILLLSEGAKATFLIPPDLGYGAQGAGGVIPPNAWLLFNVELVSVK